MKVRSGYIITNGYIRNKKFDEVTELYKLAAKKFNIKLVEISTAEVIHGISENDVKLQGLSREVDFVIFLDKDIRLARAIEARGVRVFNSASVVEVCDDKSATFFALTGQDIAMPKTIVAPLVFPGTYDEEEDSFISSIEKELTYPIIVKESFGSFGQQVYSVKNQEELKVKRKALAYIPHIYQEFVESSIGRDVRVHVVGNEVVASMLRTSKTDFRANVSSGGRMQTIALPKTFSDLAIKVAKKLGADFVGVDLLFGKEGEPILCEVNSNAHIKNILDCTGINVAEFIMRYIERELGHV